MHGAGLGDLVPGLRICPAWPGREGVAFARESEGADSKTPGAGHRGLHQLRRTEAAREALEQADAAADDLLRGGLAADVLKIPDAFWQNWLLFHVLRREAHEAIHGKPMPESPFDRLFRGRLLYSLDQPDKAEAEFTAAIELRPSDATIWLTRARVFAKLGWKDRASADLAKAQQQKADDPRPWVDTGRLLAELGEQTQADAAFARASALAKGELNRFLESGWWVAGPYPGGLDLPCPPELEADPSKPVPAVGRAGSLKWQAVSTDPAIGDINFGGLIAGANNASFYALAHVYADRDRTASLYISHRHRQAALGQRQAGVRRTRGLEASREPSKPGSRSNSEPAGTSSC